MMRAPLAPSASRTLISRCRLMARSSSRLATFTHAMSSTKATAPSRISSVGRRLPTTDFEQRPDADAHVLVLVRELRRQAGGDHLGLGLRLLDGDAGLQPPDRAPAAIAARLHDRARALRPLVVERGRDPHLGRLRLDRKPESGRHHADDGEARVVEVDGASDHARRRRRTAPARSASSASPGVRSGRRRPHLLRRRNVRPSTGETPSSGNRSAVTTVPRSSCASRSPVSVRLSVVVGGEPIE